MKPASSQALTATIMSTVAIFIFGWLAAVGIGLSVNAIRQSKTTGENVIFPILALVYSSIITVLYISIL